MRVILTNRKIASFLLHGFNNDFSVLEGCEYRIWTGKEGIQYIVTNKGMVYMYIEKYEIMKELHQSYCKGYKVVSLMPEKGKAIQMKVHRLVAYSFIPNPKNKPEVNHINGNRADNRVENLEWCTREENEQHKKKLGYKVSEETKEKIRKALSGKNSYRSKPVMCIETGEKWDTAKQASEAMGLSKNAIAIACKTGSRTKGYHWKFI